MIINIRNVRLSSCGIIIFTEQILIIHRSLMNIYTVNFGNYLIYMIIFTSFCYPQSSYSPVPQDCRQMVLVLTDSVNATEGFLYRFEGLGEYKNWHPIAEKIPIVLGRNGLAWGRGLNPIDTSKLPIKIEGDGKSPAGVFTLSSAFGYARSDEMKGLKIHYIHITSTLECIDDVNSEFYNQLVNNNEVEKVDWQSSEKMYFSDIWYEQGIIVDQNINPIIKGGGSCIFLHNWSDPNETSAGCTEMDPINMKEIIYWLDASANPVLVQLTQQLYNDYQQSWELPTNINIRH